MDRIKSDESVQELRMSVMREPVCSAFSSVHALELDRLKCSVSDLHRKLESFQVAVTQPSDQPNDRERISPAPLDILRGEKQDLLQALPLWNDLRRVTSDDVTDEWLDKMLDGFRIIHLTEKERYFVEDLSEEKGPFTPRNELESLRELELVARGISAEVDSRYSTPAVGPSKIHKLILSRLDSFSSDASIVREDAVGETEVNLSTWAAEQGVRSLIQPAVFEGTGRGAVASTNIDIGDLVLEIPLKALISEDVALESDMGAALKETPGLPGETISLLWSMRERHNAESRFAPFFASLPESFHTGLGFGNPGLKALEGTLLFEEIMEARKHLRSLYDTIVPVLSGRYPELFPQTAYDWDQFLWACQLWYAYGIKLRFPRGILKTCLVPMASLLNHTIYPHITHFSTLNESTNTLQLYAVRQCKAGEQCYMSYGPLHSSALLIFYGVLINNNPYDYIPIDLNLEEGCETAQQISLIKKYDILSSHMVRGFHRLPTHLIAALRVACMEGIDLDSYSADPRKQMISVRNERDVYISLLGIVDCLVETLQVSESSPREEHAGTEETAEWDVLLAEQFKQDQGKFLESVRSLCLTSLDKLQDF